MTQNSWYIYNRNHFLNMIKWTWIYIFMGSSVNSENTECKYKVSLSSPLTLGIVGSYVTNGNFHQFPYTTDSLFAQAGTFTSILFIGVIVMPFVLQYLNSNENKQQSAIILAAQILQGFELQN